MNAILEERIRQGKTQKRLAHEAGIAARTLRKLERGEEVSLETMGAVRKALGIRTIPQTSAAIGTPRSTQVDEKSADQGIWGRFFDEYNGHIALALVAIAGLMMIGVIYLCVDMILYQAKRNAILEVTVDAGCSDYQSRLISREVEEALLGTQVLRHQAHDGTEGCVVKLDLHTEEKQSAAVEKLQTKALHAKFLGFRE
nr:helix-turn-helix transcriptional regulator [Neorhizobium tomejilense]